MVLGYSYSMAGLADHNVLECGLFQVLLIVTFYSY